jgi:hypothetical protein
MLKWWGLLMTNVRMLVFVCLLFVSQPVYYFWFELIPLNCSSLPSLSPGKNGRIVAENCQEAAKHLCLRAKFDVVFFCVSNIEISEV